MNLICSFNKFLPSPPNVRETCEMLKVLLVFSIEPRWSTLYHVYARNVWDVGSVISFSIEPRWSILYHVWEDGSGVSFSIKPRSLFFLPWCATRGASFSIRSKISTLLTHPDVWHVRADVRFSIEPRSKFYLPTSPISTHPMCERCFLNPYPPLPPARCVRCWKWC